jgi:hypothetical protein
MLKAPLLHFIQIQIIWVSSRKLEHYLDLDINLFHDVYRRWFGTY